MTGIKLIFDLKKNQHIVEKIIKDCQSKWNDTEAFLNQIFEKGEILAVAYQNNDTIIGFSLAKKIFTKKGIAIAFLATRVFPDYRNKGIAKKFIKKIMRYFIFRDKLLNLLNWFKPVYFITATANPMVYDKLRKSLNIIPSFNSRQPNEIEIGIAEIFSKNLNSQFHKDNFMLSNAFLGSAEFYEKEKDIPWSNNEQANVFLEDKIRLKQKKGNGLIVIGKIF